MELGGRPVELGGEAGPLGVAGPVVGTCVTGSGLIVASAQARTGGGEQPLLLVNEDEEHLGVDVAGLGDLPG